MLQWSTAPSGSCCPSSTPSASSSSPKSRSCPQTRPTRSRIARHPGRSDAFPIAMHAARQLATALAACEHSGRSPSGRNDVLPRPRAIIAEDEPLLREELAELLGSLWPELDVVAQTGDGIATLREVEAHAPDVLFLDIQMPGLTGLEVA